MGKIVINFGVDMRSPVHTDDKIKRYLNSWYRFNKRVR